MTPTELNRVLNPRAENVVPLVEVNEVFRLRSYELREGEYGQYAVLDIVTLAGRELQATCGGVAVLDQLTRLSEAGALPAMFRVGVRTSRASGREYVVLEPDGL